MHPWLDAYVRDQGPVSFLETHVMSACLSLVMLILMTRLRHCVASPLHTFCFPLAAIKNLWRSALRPYSVPAHPLVSASDLASTDDSGLNQALLWCLGNDDFNATMPFTFLSRHKPSQNPPRPSPSVTVLMGFYFIQEVNNLWLPLFILMLRLSQIWPLGASSKWLLCPLIYSHFFLHTWEILIKIRGKSK